MAPPHRKPTPAAGHRLDPSLLDLGRWIGRGRLGLEDTPLVCILLKESLDFFVFNRCPWRQRMNTFFEFKGVFLAGLIEMRFLLFTSLPLDLNCS